MKKVVVTIAVIAAAATALPAYAGWVFPKLGPRTCVPDPSGAPVIRCY